MDKEANLRSMNENDLDDLLEQRGAQAFDAAWCQIFEVVECASIDIDFKDLFIRLSNVTRNHEIVSYIIEDCELLAKVEKVDISSEFVTYLNKCYDQGNVPHVW